MKEKSNGRLQIQVFAAGELVPAFETFQAVSDGTIECGNSAAYYWAGKEPAVQWFAGIPFGMNSVGMAKWIHGEGGQELWEEVYRPFNLIPRPAGNMGMQMGGWFNKKINTIDDFKGLKMRIPGLGGKVVGEAGGTVVLLPGGEIFTSLERGVIDATEWVGPYLDLRMGFYQAAKFYYYPGWHEPGTMLEFIFNRKAYLSLPPDLQSVIDQCALDCERWSYKETEKRNREAINDLVIEKKVVLMKFPDQVLEGLNRISDNVLYKESLKTGMAKKVYDAYRAAQLKFGESASYLANSYYEELR